MTKKNTEITAVEKVTGEVVMPIFNAEEQKKYKDLCTGIRKEVDKVETAYFVIAKKIYMLYQNKLYRCGNFANIYDMALDKFKITRATCNNYINICTRFGKVDEKKGECIDLLPAYKKYSSSKLVAMLNMPEELIKEINPEMSVREIKRKKQFYDDMKLIEQPEESKDSGTTGTQKKPAQKQRIELLKGEDIFDVLEVKDAAFLEKLETFEKEHPDTKYHFAITLEYEGV